MYTQALEQWVELCWNAEGGAAGAVDSGMVAAGGLGRQSGDRSG